MPENQTIQISWKLNQPPLEASSQYTFLPEPLPASSPIEDALRWPAGTHAALEVAFRRGLGRYIRWGLSAVPEPEPWIQAAKVYKRGVQTSLSSATSISGTYLVVLEESMAFLSDYRDHHIVVDKNVFKSWPEISKILPGAIPINISESNKNLTTAAKLAELQNPKNAPWLIIGGGVLADTAAFVASNLGLPFTLVPTTLLAQVDACVGGKTGVNFAPYGKNQVGIFSFPAKVHILTNWLNSLPPQTLREGISEALKHAILSGDHSHFKHLVELGQTLDTSLLSSIIMPIINTKAQIISLDAGEIGQRAQLNFGHTMGHALEAISHTLGKNVLTHGRAVAVGILFAALLSKNSRQLPQEQVNIIHSVLRDSFALPSAVELSEAIGSQSLLSPSLWKSLMGHIRQDKKAIMAPTTQWILIEEIGKCARQGDRFTVDVADGVVYQTWQELVELIKAT